MPDSPLRVLLLTPDSMSPGESVPSFYKRLLDSLQDGVYVVDRDRKIQYWNKGAENLTGYPASEAVGRYCFDNFLVHVNEAGCALCLNGCPLTSTIADGHSRQDEVYLRHKLGHRVSVSVHVEAIEDSAGHIVGGVEVFSDVTDQKRLERRVGELESLAFLDALTGMPNRRYSELRVKQALQEVEQFGRSIGLLMIDVDEFKSVNDRYGHEVGDEVLRTVCRTFTTNLRSGDTVGRWGGDEILIIVKNVSLAALSSFAQKCRMLIEESIVPVGDEQIRITVSMGATLMQQGDSDQSAIKRADALMYKSKTSGRNRVAIG